MMYPLEQRYANDTEFTSLKKSNPDAYDAKLRLKASLLTPQEVAWRECARLFESGGYKLVPRLQPDWVPSWQTSYRRRNPLNCDDSYPGVIYNPVDGGCNAFGTRTADGKEVVIEKYSVYSTHFRILTYLSTLDNTRADPHNHCILVLDSISDPEDPTIAYLVVPSDIEIYPYTINII